MLTRLQSIIRKNDGTSIIEFAIILPVFLLLLLGIIEFSLMMFASSVIEGATNAAARMNKTGLERSQADNDTQKALEDMARIRQLILERGYNIIQDNEDLQISVVPAGGSAANTVGGSGEMVTYRTTYTWHVMTPIISEIIAPDTGTMTLSSEVVVINEPYDDNPENNDPNNPVP